MYSTEQVLIARRRHVETILGLTGKSLEGVERLIDLQLRTVRSAIEDTSQAALAAVSARDVAALIGARMARVQPAAEKAAAYSREFLEIVASTGAELTRVAGVGSADTKQQLVDAAAGADAAVEEAGRVSAEALSNVREAAFDSAEALQDVDTATQALAQATAGPAEELPAQAAVEPVAQPSVAVSTDAPAKAQPRSRRSAA